MQMFNALDLSPDCLIIKSTHASELLSQNHHTLQEAPGREVSADAGKAAGRAKPRNPIHLETGIPSPTGTGSYKKWMLSKNFFVGPKWSIVKRNLFICVGVVSRALTMTFL